MVGRFGGDYVGRENLLLNSVEKKQEGCRYLPKVCRAG